MLCAWGWGDCSGPRNTRRPGPSTRTAIDGSGSSRAWSRGERQVRKHRSFYAPLLIWLGGPLATLLDTGVRVLPQRDWEDRERRIYRSLYGAAIRIDADGTLVLPCLPGETLATLLEDPGLEESIRKTVIERAVVALAEFHRSGLTHGDAMAENVMVDVEAGVARWFDFETVHESSRPMDWRRADDVRALLVTCLVRTGPKHVRRDSPAHSGCLRRRGRHPTAGHELHISVSARVDLPPRPGRVVDSVFPGDRPVAALAPRRVAPPVPRALHHSPHAVVDSFMRIRPATIRKAATNRTNVNGSLRTATPTMKAPTAPMPVHTV